MSDHSIIDLVIVRMGLKEDPDFFNGFLKGVIGSLKKNFKPIVKWKRREGLLFCVLCVNFLNFCG
jgi:hypothetical protein